jgi:hypothetical protein
MQIKPAARRRRSVIRMNRRPALIPALIPYPLDYQLTMRRIVGLRQEKLRAAGRAAEAREMEQVLARLQGADFGACAACGAVIPFMRLATDPATTRCTDCETGVGPVVR